MCTSSGSILSLCDDVLVVPSDSFGCKGYVRISYCVAEKTIVDSMPVFKEIMEELKAEKKG